MRLYGGHGISSMVWIWQKAGGVVLSERDASRRQLCITAVNPSKAFWQQPIMVVPKTGNLGIHVQVEVDRSHGAGARLQ